MSVRLTLPCLCVQVNICDNRSLQGRGNSCRSRCSALTFFRSRSGPRSQYGNAIGFRLRIVSRTPSRVSINLHACCSPSSLSPLPPPPPLGSNLKCAVERSCKDDLVRDHVNCRDNLHWVTEISDAPEVNERLAIFATAHE